jgi:hypothetical protein
MSSHFAPDLNIQGTVFPNRVIALFYTGIAVGDIGSGLLS